MIWQRCGAPPKTPAKRTTLGAFLEEDHSDAQVSVFSWEIYREREIKEM